jgi:predicted metal-binding membrane protein
MLLRHRRPARVGVGYFALWTALGVPVYLVGIAVNGAAMASATLSRAVPVLGGLTLVLGGLLQFTPWKAAGLDRCRCAPQCPEPGGDGAWPSALTGLRCGWNCASACSGWMLILVVLGIMNLAAMAIVASLIAVEMLALRPLWWIRLSGSAAILGGIATVLR